jgi:hypothetical protein
MCANRVSSKSSITATGSATSANTAAEDLTKKNLNEFTQTATGISTSSSPPPVVNNQTNLGHAATGGTASKKSASNEHLGEIWDRVFAGVYDLPIDYSYQPPEPNSFAEQEISLSAQSSSSSGSNAHADTDPAAPLKDALATTVYLNPFEDPDYQPAPITNRDNPFIDPSRPYAAPTADGQAVPLIFGTTNSLPSSSGPVAAPPKALNSGHFTVSLDNPFFQGTEAIPEQTTLGTNPSFSASNSFASPAYNRPPSNRGNAIWPDLSFEATLFPNGRPNVSNPANGANPIDPSFEATLFPNGRPNVSNPANGANPIDPSFEATLFPNGRPNVSSPANGANPIDPSFEATLFPNGRPAFVNADGSPANIPPISANNPFSPGYEHRNQGLFCMAMHEYALGLCQQLGLPPQLLSGLLDFYLENAIDAYKKAVDVNPDMPLDPQTEKTAALARRAKAENYVQHQIKLFGKDAFKPTFDPLTKKNGDTQTTSFTHEELKEYSGHFSKSEQEILKSSIETITTYRSSHQQIPTSTGIGDSDDGSDDAGEGSGSEDAGSDKTLMISATQSDQSQGHSIAQTQPKPLAQTQAQPTSQSQPLSKKQEPASTPGSLNKNAVVSDGTAKWAKKYPDRSDKAVQARVIQLQKTMQAEMERPLTNEEMSRFTTMQQINPQQTESQFRKYYVANKVRDGAFKIVYDHITEIASDRDNITAGRIQLPDAIKQKRLAELNEIDGYLNKLSQAFWMAQI